MPTFFLLSVGPGGPPPVDPDRGAAVFQRRRAREGAGAASSLKPSLSSERLSGGQAGERAGRDERPAALLPEIPQFPARR